MTSGQAINEGTNAMQIVNIAAKYQGIEVLNGRNAFVLFEIDGCAGRYKGYVAHNVATVGKSGTYECDGNSIKFFENVTGDVLIEIFLD